MRSLYPITRTELELGTVLSQNGEPVEVLIPCPVWGQLLYREIKRKLGLVLNLKPRNSEFVGDYLYSPTKGWYAEVESWWRVAPAEARP